MKLVARRASDGAVCALQRSVDVPGVAPPAGYVRATLRCGGMQLAPTTGGACEATYVNILDPNGRVPKKVVNMKGPDRALIIARLRGCVSASGR